MARRKKTKTKRISFRPRSPKKRKKKKKTTYRPSLKTTLTAAALLGALVLIAAAFILLDKYVEKTVPVSRTELVPQLLNVPEWATERLRQKVVVAAQMQADEKLNEDTAASVQHNIRSTIAWLDEVTVQITHDSILIQANWRKPLAMVKAGLETFYLDADLVVLDYLPMPDLPIVQIKGLSLVTEMPPPGRTWQADDAAAALALLNQLDRMDKSVVPDKPLLDEIDSIDISNFNGRENERFPHIVLYTKDNTEIIWGAEPGTWQRHLEATDKEKLTNLYAYYKEYGTLLGGAKYINLQYSQTRVSLPVDKY